MATDWSRRTVLLSIFGLTAVVVGLSTADPAVPVMPSEAWLTRFMGGYASLPARFELGLVGFVVHSVAIAAALLEFRTRWLVLAGLVVSQCLLWSVFENWQPLKEQERTLSPAAGSLEMAAACYVLAAALLSLRFVWRKTKDGGPLFRRSS